MDIWIWIAIYGTAAVVILLAAFGLGRLEGRGKAPWPAFVGVTAFKFLACAMLGAFAGLTLSPQTDGPARFAGIVFLPLALVGAVLLSGLALLVAAGLLRLMPQRWPLASPPRRGSLLAASLNAAAGATCLLLGYLTYLSG